MKTNKIIPTISDLFNSYTPQYIAKLARMVASGPVHVSVVQRSQHAKKGRSGFEGPGEYVMSVVWPETPGIDPTGHPLSEANRARGNWSWHWEGEGYWRHSGPRSSLGRALNRAYDRKAKLERILDELARVRSLRLSRGGASDPYRMAEMAEQEVA